MDWDKLRVFHAVASAGSFTHAGQMLALSQSAVSRQIGALEDELATPLFQRHARGLTLTNEGETLYGAVSDVLGRLAQAEEELKNVRESPTGSLRVTSSHGIGTYWLLPRLPDFRKQYPEIDIHLIMEDRELDLGQREADIALRMRAPIQADMIQRKLFTVHYHFCASKDYLASHGTPKTLEDLGNHTVIAYGETAAPEIRNVNSLLDLLDKAKIDMRGHVIRINNITGILQATEAGMGVAAIADYAAPNNSDLVSILPDMPTPTFDVHLAYTEALRNSKRVVAFRDFLVRAAKDWRY